MTALTSLFNHILAFIFFVVFLIFDPSNVPDPSIWNSNIYDIYISMTDSLFLYFPHFNDFISSPLWLSVRCICIISSSVIICGSVIRLVYRFLRG